MRVLTIVLVFMSLFVVPVNGAEQPVRHYTFEITIGTWEILPDVPVKSLLINGVIPGPAIEVNEGDVVEVEVVNHTPLPHTIHWHGLEVDNSQDGVPYVTQDSIKTGESFVYRFVAKPAGTHFWHCHWSTLLHVSGGMYGALIVHPKDPQQDLNRRYGVKQDHTLILDSIDPEWQERMLRMMVEMHARESQPRGHSGDESGDERLFSSSEEYTRAIREEGYRSPYLKGIPKPTYRYHLVNGHPYPLTPSIKTKAGESLRIRFINAGNIPHYLHFHGMQVLIVAIDGNSLGNPFKVNTVSVVPGRTVDVIMRPSIPGWWAVHDHAEWGSTNNGHFPGGTVFVIGVADEKGHISNYDPKIILTQ